MTAILWFFWPIFFLCASWLILILSLTGIGLMIHQIILPRPSNPSLPSPLVPLSTTFFLCFWLGWALFIAFLQIWNIFLPVNSYPLLLLLCTGMANFYLHRSYLRPFSAQKTSKTSYFTLLLIIFWIFWCANRATGPVNAHDTGLYHQLVILWHKTTHLTPGLANLAFTLALNNTNLLWTAALDQSIWTNYANHLTNSLPLTFLGIMSIHTLCLLYRKIRPINLPNILLTLWLPLGIYHALGKDICNPKTDLPMGIAFYVAMWLLLTYTTCLHTLLRPPTYPPTCPPTCPTTLLPGDHSTSSPQVLRPILVASLTLFTLAVCIKLSLAIACVLLWFLGFAIALVATKPLWPKPPNLLDRLRRTGLLWSISLSLLLAVPWVTRNYITSGYAIYPSTIAPLNLPWRVPPAVAESAQNHLANFTKTELISFGYYMLDRAHLSFLTRLAQPVTELSNPFTDLSWVAPWLIVLPVLGSVELLLPLGIAGLSLLFYLYHFRRHPISCGSIATTPILGTLLLGLLAWFFLSPEPRYVPAAAWALAAIILARAAQQCPNPRLLIALILTLIIPTTTYRAMQQLVQRDMPPWKTIPFLPPGPDHGFYPHPTSSLAPRTLATGLTIYVPSDPDNALCWNGPLPAIGWPPPNPNLSLLDPAQGFTAGFYIAQTPASSASNTTTSPTPAQQPSP